jgi:hypothetical protein
LILGVLWYIIQRVLSFISKIRRNYESIGTGIDKKLKFAGSRSEGEGGPS